MFGGGEVMRAWIIAVWLIAVVVGHFAAYKNGYVRGSDHVQAEWDAEKAATVSAQRAKEAELQASVDKLREDKNRETAKLRRTVAALTDSLRDRPERPAVPTSASAGDGSSGCTGATVYRQDGEFLIRESARADQIRLALIQCQKAYQDASGQ